MKELNTFRKFITESKSLKEEEWNGDDAKLKRGQDYEVHEQGMNEWHDLEYMGFDRNDDEHIFMDTVNTVPGNNDIYTIKVPNSELSSTVREL